MIGVNSDKVTVSSDVPQGTSSGTLLFLFHWLVRMCSSQTRLIVDVAIVESEKPEDLQKDLYAFAS